MWYLIVIYIYFNNNEITFAGHIYSVKMNISPFLYWYLKILKHFIKFSFSYFFTLKSQFKRIWTSLTLILSSKVVCIWPHWRPTKAIYFVLSKKRNAFNALDRSMYYSTEEKSRLVFTPLLKFQVLLLYRISYTSTFPITEY